MGGGDMSVERGGIPGIGGAPGIREASGVPEGGEIGPDRLIEAVDRPLAAKPENEQHRDAADRARHGDT